LDPEKQSTEFEGSEPELKEIVDTTRKARSASAPGSNGIPYKVYENCPRLCKRLWGMMKVAWRRGRLANDWHLAARGVF
jgi:hypothetical protein